MWERSKRPARSRTARCSSRMPLYWTGIIQPPNSISFAPSATCRSRSGVSWTGVSTAPGASASVTSGSVPGGGYGVGARRGPSAGLDRLRRPGDQGSLRFEREQALGFLEPDPADRFELVIVAAQVAPGGVHQEVVDGLVDAGPALDEPVLDRVERALDPDVEAGLLADFAE